VLPGVKLFYEISYSPYPSFDGIAAAITNSGCFFDGMPGRSFDYFYSAMNAVRQ
jgi:hypothetical protein